MTRTIVQYDCSLLVLFAARTRWVLADKDDARNVFEESPGIRAWAKSCEDGLEVLNSLAYAVMFSVAQKQLFCGNSVIVDCPLARPSLYERGKALASQVGATRRACQQAALLRLLC